jgi:hypothetical protein
LFHLRLHYHRYNPVARRHMLALLFPRLAAPASGCLQPCRLYRRGRPKPSTSSSWPIPARVHARRAATRRGAATIRPPFCRQRTSIARRRRSMQIAEDERTRVLEFKLGGPVRAGNPPAILRVPHGRVSSRARQRTPATFFFLRNRTPAT